MKERKKERILTRKKRKKDKSQKEKKEKQWTLQKIWMKYEKERQKEQKYGLMDKRRKEEQITRK